MFLQTILPALGLALALTGALLFWAAVQNWVADLIERMAVRFERIAYTLQSALIVIDRIVVTGQRMIAAVARLTYAERATGKNVLVEEVRPVRLEDLPADVRARLDRGEAMEYQIAVDRGQDAAQESHDPTTYRLAVRRAE